MSSTLERGMQRRTELLLGTPTLERLQTARVILFGVGGVGSWCAEALVRSGIRHLTIVDSDRVCITNCNRQLMATGKTLGQVKVEALRERLIEINACAEIHAIQGVYNAQNADSFHLEEYDYVIDAIDSLAEKADLILRVTRLKHVMLISSMGAALRVNPFAVRKAEFWQVKGDPLARALRNRFKRDKTFPARKFYCVYSEEPALQNRGEFSSCGTDQCYCQQECQQGSDHDWNSKKAQINGSMCHITAIFGMSIAGIVINDVMSKE